MNKAEWVRCSEVLKAVRTRPLTAFLVAHERGPFIDDEVVDAVSNLYITPLSIKVCADGSHLPPGKSRSDGGGVKISR